MVEAVSTNFLPISYVYASRYTSGRVSLPVLPREALYANFQHVGGVPALDGTPAYSIDKLHILDMLIAGLESVKDQPLAAREAPATLNPGRVDALIAQYGAEYHSLAAAPAQIYSPQPPSQPGILFSLAA
ncbi:MAG TPA: hypothetical protein VFL04_08065 [Rectinemataceae bacterium]|nr:hypothetical protein [Rectinemataceae bacterium]